MTDNRDLFMADVVHKAFVSVDEAGTEVAAATTVIMESTAAPEEPVEVTSDSNPFIIFRCTRGFLIVAIGLVSIIPSLVAHLNNADKPV